MRYGKILYGIACASLLYFVLFVIPPVSSIASECGMIDCDFDFAINLERSRTHIYVIDIFLWEQLEESEHQDSSSLSVLFSPYDLCQKASTSDIGLQPASGNLEIPVLFSSVAFQPGGHPLSRTSTIRFERSGISPPSCS